MKTFLREPLLHFLLLAAGMFVLFDLVSADGLSDDEQDTTIVISAGQQQAIAENFKKTRQYYPQKEEMDRLIAAFVREEVFYREALKMELDRNDPIVRNRLSKKLGFLTEDLLAPEPPEDKELERYLADNPDKFMREARLSFRHIYFNSSKLGNSAQADVNSMLADIKDLGIDAPQLGDKMMVQDTFEQASEFQIARVLGKKFVESLLTTPTASWQGPVTSGFGLHLVYINDHVERQLPLLADVRDQVLREWTDEKRKTANQEFYNSLRKRYQVTVEPISSNNG